MNPLAVELFAFDRAPPELPRDCVVAFDRASISARSYDKDGHLRVDVSNISKATVNPYYGREIPGSEALGLDPNKIYKLYRDPAEIAKGAQSFAGKPLLDTHVAVNAESPKPEHIAGAIGSNVRFEMPYLKSSLHVWTKKAIDDILAKKAAQLSCSYRYRADMTPGVSHDGVVYDGVMRDIEGNHVALVKEGRAGPDVYVNDSMPEGLKMKFKFPNIVATAAAALALTDAQQLALDQAFDKKAKDEEVEGEAAMDSREEALDAREEAMDAEEEKKDEKKEGEVARGDRKKARDSRKAARDKRAMDRKASDEARKAMDSRLTPPPKPAAAPTGISRADLEAAVKLAEDSAVARVEAREQAKRDVAPLVGPITVAMDSAESVYRFALDQAKVDHKGVHASALSAIVAAEIRARKAATTRLASDSVRTIPTEHSISNIFGRKAS